MERFIIYISIKNPISPIRNPSNGMLIVKTRETSANKREQIKDRSNYKERENFQFMRVHNIAVLD